MRSALGNPLANGRNVSADGGDTHLSQYWQLLLRRRRLVLAVAAGCVLAGTVWALSGGDVYRATAQLLVEREEPAVLTFKRVTEVNERGWSDEFYQTQHKMVRSRKVAASVIASLDLLQHPEFGGPRDPKEVAAAMRAAPGASRLMDGAVAQLTDDLDVEWLRGTRIITLSYEAHDRALAATIANQAAQAYIDAVLETRRQTAAEAAAFLTGQLEEQRRKVAEAERALQSQRDKERLIESLVSVDDRRTLIEQRLKELATARNLTRTRRLERQALYEQMKAAASPLELPDVMRNSVAAQLRIELASLERRLAFLREKYLDRHPEVVRVRDQIAGTQRRLAEEAEQMIRAAENDYKAAAAQEASLDGALEKAKAEYEDLSLRTMQYEAGKRDLDAARAVLAGITSRLKETDVALELRSVHVRVLEPAAPPRKRSGPRRALKLFASILFGLAASIGLAVALESMNDSVRTPADVRTLALPLLGVVPEAAGRNGAPADGAADGFLEPCRLLRATLQHALGGDGPGRVVLLTSTGAGEGKTVNSVNLAASFARQGSRVLLVDADLRQAAATRMLGGARAPGLAELLAGRADVTEAVRTDRGAFALLPAGGPGGEDRVSVPSLTPLLASLRARYDWIVLDAPPVGPVADALVLSSLADGTVLVVRAEHVPMRAAALTAERLAQAGARVLGVLLNRAPVDRYRYEYGFHYGRYEPAVSAPPESAPPS